MTDDKLENPIMGVILASHFCRKKGIGLGLDKAEIVTTKELQPIHDMGTYEAHDTSTLKKQKK